MYKALISLAGLSLLGACNSSVETGADGNLVIHVGNDITMSTHQPPGNLPAYAPLYPGSKFVSGMAMGIDAAQSIGATNSLEKMLAHQMAVAHEAGLRVLDRAMSYETRNDSVETARLINAAARLLSLYQDGLHTLQRLRTGGTQTVVVQHVKVESGAQAVIGSVSAGGRGRTQGPA